MTTGGGSEFSDLDNLVLHLKGLVLVRGILARGDAGDHELELYDEEIEHVRDRLADVVKNGGQVEHPAAVGSTMTATGR